MATKKSYSKKKHTKDIKRKAKLAKRDKKLTDRANNQRITDAVTNKLLYGPSESQYHENLERTFGELLSAYCPISTAGLFARLMLKVECHSYLHTLESAIRLSLSFCGGTKKPTRELISIFFDKLEDVGITAMNDPAEDIHVSTVWFEGHAYRVLTGLWDGAVYQLQNFLNVVDDNHPLCREILLSIRESLKASDSLIVKAKLKEGDIDNTSAHESISEEILDEVMATDYLEFLSVGSCKVLPELDHSVLADLFKQPFGACDLEAKPFLSDAKKQYLIFPSIIPTYIKRLVISHLKAVKNDDFIDSQYCQAILESLEDLKLLREFSLRRAYPLGIKEVGDGWLASDFAIEFDQGYIFQFIFLFQRSQTLDSSWFSKIVELSDDSSKYLESSLKGAKSHFLKKIKARKGCSIIVPCILGNQVTINIDFYPTEDWMLEVIPLHDFITLSQDYDSSPRRVWRIIESKIKLQALDVKLINMSGFLNLYSYAKQNNYALITHEYFKDPHISPSNVVIHIPSDVIADFRRKVFRDNHRTIVKYHGIPVAVRRGFSNSLFIENEKYNIYVPESVNQGLLQCVYLYSDNYIWLTQEVDSEIDFSHQFQCFETALSWIERIITTVADSGLMIPDEFHEWRLIFSYPDDKHVNPLPEIKDVLNCFTNEFKTSVLTTKFNMDFFSGLRHELNFSECSLVLSLITYLCEYNSSKNSTELLKKVVPDQNARHMHAFVANSYSEFFDIERDEPIYVEETDSNNIKLGMGWLCRQADQGNEIVGKEECKKYISSLVFELWKKQKSKLQHFDRKSLIIRLLENFSLSEHQRTRWNRTFRANTSLHTDHEQLFSIVNRQLSLINGASLFSRLVVEMAICESAEEGGVPPGILDIQALMCSASTMHYLGGLSEAINYDCVEPRIVISTFGDVMSDQMFTEQIMDSYGHSMNIASLKSHSRSYSKYLFEHEPVKKVAEYFSSEFCDAWQEEFGSDLDSYRELIDDLENMGHMKNELVYCCNKDELMSSISMDAEIAQGMLDQLTLYSRQNWNDIPQPFNQKDWEPWRFRRRFSLILRPIIKLDNQELIIAPALLRKAFTHLVDLCSSGSLDGSRFFSAKMKKWIGKVNNENGISFNSEVANKLNSLGWQVKKEKKLTEILSMPLDIDYGDVDVFAWNPNLGIVLAIECKSLDVAKTQGEVARQLSEFRGKIKHNGKNDLLLKHHRRFSLLREESKRVAAFTKIESDVIRIEAFIVFSNSVPMAFDTSRAFQDEIEFVSFDDLDIKFVCK
tara:strand:+ start:888 stop:4697 length:3810 start_codon:yes stop_codon:yes gene_type:complete